MNWNNAKVSFPNWVVSAISVASYNGSNWIDAGGTAAVNVTTTGTITSNSVSSFNLFAFGSRAFPIPVTLINFTAKRLGDYTQIAWTTVSEHNVDHFVTERSDDNAYFYAIGQLQARNSGNAEMYSSRDNAIVNHIAYYRLKCIDIDGAIKFSRIVSITTNDVNNQLVLLNNPVHDKLVLVAGNQLKGVFNYDIRTMNGQVIQEGKLILLNGGQYQLPLKENLNNGTYVISISNTSQSFRYKFVRQ